MKNGILPACGLAFAGSLGGEASPRDPANAKPQAASSLPPLTREARFENSALRLVIRGRSGIIVFLDDIEPDELGIFIGDGLRLGNIQADARSGNAIGMFVERQALLLG